MHTLLYYTYDVIVVRTLSLAVVAKQLLDHVCSDSVALALWTNSAAKVTVI
jgi:hypothetical protein